MNAASKELEEIDRFHDDEPERAAAALRAFDATSLAADELPTLAFLLNHVLGEKFGAWRDAGDRLGALAKRADAPAAVWRQLAVAHRYCGNAAAAAESEACFAQAADSPPEAARWAVELTALTFTPDKLAQADKLQALAMASAACTDAGGLNAALAAGFNNATTSLLTASLKSPLTARVRQALVAGADAGRTWWYRAGTWINHERAEYLVARVAVRVGDYASAIAAAERGLAIVEANGNDPVERAFLLQPLAAALTRQGETQRAEALRTEGDRLADAFEDASLRPFYRQDTDELFGTTQGAAGPI